MTVNEQQSPSRKTPPQIIFMHIPKCAGTSLQQYLIKCIYDKQLGRIVLFDTIYEAEPSDAVATSKGARYVGGHIGWDIVQRITAPETYLFTMLRDPVERFFSSYTYFQRFPSHYKGYEEAKPIKGMMFEEYCRSDYMPIRAFTDNGIVRQLAGNMRHYPESTDELEDMIETAISHLRIFNHIGFQDNFAASLSTLCKDLGMPEPDALPKKNVTAELPPGDGPQPRLDYTREEIIELAGDRLKGDFEVYAAARALMKQ